MQLMVDSGVLRCIWGASTEYWFSRMDYSVYKSSELPTDDSSKLFEAGFIPFVSVSNEEVIRAYVQSLSNKKIVSAFEGLDGEAYVEMFWKYFNAYKQVSDGFNAFEEKYVADKLIAWCNENTISYKFV